MDGSVSTALILGAVALSEGIRATPTGSVVLRRVLAGAWAHAEPLALGRGFTLPSFGTPFMVAVLVPPQHPPADARGLADLLRARLARARRTVRALRLLGVASLVLLVAGVPALTARHGWFGLVAALAGILILAITQAGVVYRGMVRASAARATALGAAARVLWPFTTPRSAEILLDAIVARMPPLVVARVLLDDAGFHRMVRPLAWDVLNGRVAPDAATLTALCDASELRAIVDAAPDGQPRFCPRCAAGYTDGVAGCVECSGVAIV